MVHVAERGGAGSATIIILSTCLWWTAVSAQAEGNPINISAPDLSSALSQLARTQNVELLFNQSLVSGKPSPRVQNAVSVDEALDQLLSGTELSYRLTQAGTFVIFFDPTKTRPSVSQSLPIEEILIVGRVTQNTDIRRSQNDVQPYQVFDAATIENSQSTTVEDFFRTRLPANTHQLETSQDPVVSGASVRSQVDFRGLGTDQTLILVDGRRLPSIPETVVGLGQSDLNGLSPGAIDRIETLSGSASGIFGIGAAGGAVNVILKRDYEGAELTTTSGISQRGDGLHWGLDGRIGYSSAETGTRIMFALGQREDKGLMIGDRDFAVKARELRALRSPQLAETVVSPSINFNSIRGEPLTLKPSFGGGSLGATTTFMPVDSPPVAAGGAAILMANAGQYDLRLSPDSQGAQQSLITRAQMTSVLMTVRQDITSWSEVYFDFLHLRDDGTATVPGIDTRFNLLGPANPNNPFNQTVSVTFPVPNLAGRLRADTLTERLSAGIILRLGSDWSVSFDAARGTASIDFAEDLATGATSIINPISGPAVLASDLSQYEIVPYSRGQLANRLDDFNLRMGGSVIQLPGGPLALAATAEFRDEKNSNPIDSLNPVPDDAVRTRRKVLSAFVEARAPLVAADGEWEPLRGLELQVALRTDHYKQIVPSLVEGSFGPAAINKATIFAETYGGKVEPIPGLVLRASMSTGFTPPTPVQTLPWIFPSVAIPTLTDPKRGGSPLVDKIGVQFLGSPSLQPQHAKTYMAGMVLRPDFIPGLRFSIDYSRLRTTEEISSVALGDFQYFIDREDILPGRIKRAPLTAADMSNGFKAGVITYVDAGNPQLGRSELQTVDFDFDYLRDTRFGLFRFYGRATWEPTFRRWDEPGKPSYNISGHAEGPLSWRGNGGIDWMRGYWSSGINVQFYNAYSGYYGAPPTPIQLAFLGISGPINNAGTNSSYIPSQVYVDWTLAYRSILNVSGGQQLGIEYRFGIRNVFDSHPPIVGGTFAVESRNTGLSAYDYNPFGGYSPYGDPRGRRFEFKISASF